MAHTVESVLEQDYEDVEHIVVDGGSTDGTLQVLEDYRDRITLLSGERDGGIYFGMNRGIATSVGDAIGFLGADDFFDNPSVLSRIAHTLKSSGTDACYADLVYVDNQDASRIVRFWKSQPYNPGLFENGWMPAHPTFYARREIYTRFGNFDTRYRFQSDFEHTARLIAVNGITTTYVPEIWVRMRIGGTTNRSVSNIVRGNLESYRACRELGLNMTPMYFVRKFAMRIPQFFRKPPS